MDLIEYKKMWDGIFGDPPQFSEFYHSNICTKNKIIDYWDGGRLAGMIHLNPYTIYARGSLFNCYYIVGVAVLPDMRGRGIMRDMMERAVSFMKSCGCPFTFLMPKKDEYYTGFGFRKIYDTCRIDINDINSKPDILGRVRHGRFTDIETLDKGGLDNLAGRINNDLALRYDYFSWRTSDYLLDMLGEHKCQNGGVMLYENNNAAVLFSYDIYGSCMYVERFEGFSLNCAGDIYQALAGIISFAREKGMSRCVFTLDKRLAEEADSVISRLDAVINNAYGIMALSLYDSPNCINKMKNKSFFDEIV